jgi:platelet-activating factor acetylhydrolase IB subunit alpha
MGKSDFVNGIGVNRYCTRTIHEHDAWIKSITLNHDSSVLASCAADHTIKVFATQTGHCIQTLHGHDNVVESIVFSHPKSDVYIQKMLDDSIQTLSHRSRASSLAAASTPISSSPTATGSSSITSEYLISAARDKLIKLWNISTGQCIRTISAHDNWVRDIRIHPSGRYLISCSDDKSIRVYDILKQFKCIRTLDNAHAQFITCLVFTSPSHIPLLATGSVDHTVNIYDCKPVIEMK